MNKSIQFYLGIDISKKTFDVALLMPDDKRKNKKFKNDVDGFQFLRQWLSKHAVDNLHACMEATNTYGDALAEYLYNEGYAVSVVNPARVKGFSQSQLLRTKTDKQDASLIGQFCKAMKPRLWQPEPLNVRELKGLVRRLDALIAMRQQEVNRLDVAETIVRDDIEYHIEHLDLRIKQIRETIKEHIDNDPDLKSQKELLLTIPGIGEKTMATLLAYFSSIHRFKNAKQLASFCGVAPRQWQSGTSVNGRGRMSKVGSSHLRKALFLPVMVALKYNPMLSDLKLRMAQKGKPKMVIVGAAMRKLIHIVFGVLKNQTPFNEKLLTTA